MNNTNDFASNSIKISDNPELLNDLKKDLRQFMRNMGLPVDNECVIELVNTSDDIFYFIMPDENNVELTDAQLSIFIAAKAQVGNTVSTAATLSSASTASCASTYGTTPSCLSSEGTLLSASTAACASSAGTINIAGKG